MNQKIKSLYGKDKNFVRLLGVCLFIFALCAILRPRLFLRTSNFLSMCRQFPEFGIMSIGISLTILTGGIDLSSVFVANLSSIIAAKTMLALIPDMNASDTTTLVMIFLACCLSLLIGLLCGMFNGFLISKIGIPPILATLGSQQLFWGIAIIISKGKSISGLPMKYFEIGNTDIFGFIPISLVWFIVIALLFGMLLSRTKFGKRLYLLGTNPVASSFAGLHNARLLIMTYACSGILAAFSGLIMMATTNSTKADYGASYTMQCILIVVMGGFSPSGGEGNIRGLVLVVLILQMLSSTLNMFENVSNFYRDIIWGVALVAVLIINHTINKREARIRK